MRDNEGRCGVMRGDEGVMRGGECKCTVCCHLYSHKTSEATLLKTNCFIKNYEIQFKCKIKVAGLNRMSDHLIREVFVRKTLSSLN